MKSLNIDLKQLSHLFAKKPKSLHVKNPSRDWAFILLTTLILLIAILGVGIYVFYGVEEGTLFAQSNDAVIMPPRIDRGSINSVNTYYNDKEHHVDMLIHNELDVVDPSL